MMVVGWVEVVRIRAPAKKLWMVMEERKCLVVDGDLKVSPTMYEQKLLEADTF